MQEAIRLAEENVVRGLGGPFGAVVVKDGEIIGRGANRVTSCNDPTAHAEVNAIREACARMNDFRLTGCELYTNCEPCPMCLAAIYWARIERVYYANTRDDAAAIGFDDEFFYREVSAAPAERRIPMLQMMRVEAQAAFEQWREKPDKIRY